MKFTIVNHHVNGIVQRSTEQLAREFELRGAERVADINGDPGFVLNLVSVDDPHIFRRMTKSVFVVTVFTLPPAGRDEVRTASYGMLIRTLSNLVVALVPGDGGGAPHAYFTTPEAGFYDLPFDPGAVCARIAPIVGAHWATDNLLVHDLPARLCGGSSVVDALRRGAQALDKFGVLPVPFPLESILSEEDRRHLFKIFGIAGASYGNLSAREPVPELGECTFWMTGRGVDKRNLAVIGRDVLMVTGYDEARNLVLLSVPEGSTDAARVSVDAIEHFRIYRSFPGVGAIVHVHGWMEGVACTRQNYPCGTRELAEEVVALLATTDDPTQAVVGLKNHGLTITGHTLDEIFARIAGRLLVTVPMYA